MDVERALGFIEGRRQGVLATHRTSGRPQMSNIVFGTLGERIGISITTDRAKAVNMRRDLRASLHVSSEDFWSWVVLDCEVELTPVAEAPGDDTNETLMNLYRIVSGEHPDWDDFQSAMVKDRRLAALLTPVHAYGQLPD